MCFLRVQILQLYIKKQQTRCSFLFCDENMNRQNAIMSAVHLGTQQDCIYISYNRGKQFLIIRYGIVIKRLQCDQQWKNHRPINRCKKKLHYDLRCTYDHRYIS